MPSVASEVQNSLARTALPSSGRSPSEARQPDTPFADMLDSAASSAEPPASPPVAQPNRTARAERSDGTKPAHHRGGDDAAPAKGQAGAKGAAAGKDGAKPKAAKAATDAKDSSVVPPSPDGTTDQDKPVAEKGDDKTKTKASADDSAVPQASADAIPAPTPVTPQPVVAAPVTIALPAATAPTANTDGDEATAGADADAIAALQAAAGQKTPAPKAVAPQGVVPRLAAPQAGAVKPTQADRASDDGDDAAAAQTDAPAKAATAVDPKAVPQIDGSGDNAPRGKADGTPAQPHHSFSELLSAAKDAAPQGATDGTAAAKGVDQAQGLVPAPTGTTAAPTTANPAGPAQIQTAAVPLAGIAVEIVKEASAGKSHFEIRLDPPDLGRIDVRLSVDHDGRVTSHLSADRPDTLDMLKRDAADLQRALQQAGLKTSDNGLEFSLRQQNFSRDDAPARNTAQIVVPDDEPAPIEAARQGYGRLLGLGGGLDIRV